LHNGVKPVTPVKRGVAQDPAVKPRPSGRGEGHIMIISLSIFNLF